MAFFDRFNSVTSNVTAKLNSLGQTVSSQTSLFAETTKLNSRISDEEKQINSFYEQIGKNYFEANKDNDNAEYKELIMNIKDAMARIKSYQDQLRSAKGYRACPQCGNEVPTGSMFCSVCGNKMPVEAAPVVAGDPAPFTCPGCGSEFNPGMTFCNKCGTKLPELNLPPLGSTIINTNGSFETPGMSAQPAAPVAPTAPTAPAAPADFGFGNSTTSAMPTNNDGFGFAAPTQTSSFAATPINTAPQPEKKTISIAKKD